MSGITSSVGIFSGIDTGSLIEQLLAIDGRPRILAQRRIGQLELQRTAFLEINTRLSALKSATEQLRTDKVFQKTKGASSDPTVLSAKVTSGAAKGSYSFIVDRLVTSQQLITRGFADSSSSGAGLTDMTFESAKARLDTDTSLALINGGSGLERGKIVITDSANRSATIDLSKAATVSDVLTAINTNGTALVTASVRDGSFVIKDNAGATVTIANASGSTAATSLGIVGSATGSLTGTSVYSLNAGTALSTLNDSRGVEIRTSTTPDSYSFSLNVGGTLVKVNAGDVYESVDGTVTKTASAVTTMGGVITRMNEALSDAGITTASASVNSSGRVVVTDTGGATISVAENGGTTAADLGLTGSASGTLTGSRILAGMNTTLGRSLAGGSGLSGDGTLLITSRDGTQFSLTLDKNGTIDDWAQAIETASGTGVNGKPRVSMSVNSAGTGVQLVDNSGQTGLFTVRGTGGNNSAIALGLSASEGVASSTITGTNLQHAYIGRTSSLRELSRGAVPSSGTIRITDSSGASRELTITSDITTVGQLIDRINSFDLNIKAELNANGDGMVVREDVESGSEGAVKIKIEDVSGAFASSIGLAGEASGLNDSNKVNASLEKVVDINVTDTLQQVVEKINLAAPGMKASIVNDGSTGMPYRLSLAATSAAVVGRVLVSGGADDLGARTLDAGLDAKIFYGSPDPAKAVLLGGSTNSVSGVISGVSIDLKSTSNTPVTLTISDDTESMEAGIGAMVDAFNRLVDYIDAQSKYDEENDRGGPLLGDSTSRELRTALFNSIQSAPKNVSSRFQRFFEVGIRVGEGGNLEFDASEFKEALEKDPAAVEALFNTRVQEGDGQIDLGDGVSVRDPSAGRKFSSLGLGAALQALADRYVDTTDGVMTLRTQSLERQVNSQEERIERVDKALERRRTMYQRQFLAMEQAIAQLQAQQSSLSQISALSAS